MASGSTASDDSKRGTVAAPATAHASYIEEKLEKTGGDVRLVEVTAAVLTIFVLLLVYLLAMVVIDHWIVPTGLHGGIRAFALLLLLGGLVFYATRNLLPHLLYRINPAFAAHTIERSQPSLKNSVLNFLLLRQQVRHVPEVVIRGLEKQAATGLSHVSVDSVVDHRQLVRGGVALVGVLLLCGLYMIFSPKNMLPSVGRLLVPWADIDPVTRVRIKHVLPGNSEVQFGAHTKVSAEVNGLREQEAVFLTYSSRGGGAVDQRMQMFREAGKIAYACRFPTAERGLVSDVDYWIEAGDCVSPSYRLELVTAPTLQVQSIEYHYPSYTGLASRSVEGVGDIKAIEGTRVVIHAEANQDIAAAAMTLEGLREQTIPMTAKHRIANCQLLLSRRVVGEDSIPELTGYHLHLTTPSGAVNEKTIQHRITITRDQPPLVEILRPEESRIEVPLNQEFFFQVRARDPDFRLAGVSLIGRCNGRTIFEEDLIKHHKLRGEPSQSAYREVFRFSPQAYQLEAGQIVNVIATAVDNRQPTPNPARTPQVEVHITASESRTEETAGERESPETENRRQEQQGGPGTAGGPQGEQQAGGAGAKDGESGEGEAGSGQGAQNGKDAGAARTGQGDSKGEAGSQNESHEGREQSAGGKQADGDDRGGNPSSHRNGSSQESQGGGTQGGAAQQSGQEESSAREGQGGGEEKVDNDGDAFQKLQEQIQKERSERREQEGEPADDLSAEQAAGGRRGDKTEPQHSSESEGDRNGDKAPRQTEGSAGSEGSGSKKSSERPDPESQREGGALSGSPPRGEAEPTATEGASDAGAKSSREPGDNGVGSTGEQPPPPPEGLGADRHKSDSKKRDPRSDKEPADSGISKHESNSAEGEEGSRHGKGQEGGGQQSRQSGEGAGGSNTPADSGFGAAEEPGSGESGNRGGNRGTTDQRTGSHTEEQGDATAGDPQQKSSQENSGSQGAPNHGRSQAAAGRSPGGDPQAGSSRSSQQGEQGADATKDDPVSGGGSAIRDESEGEDGPLREPGADAPNLEYARETTALVLDYLQYQLDRGGIDPELKRKFGWTDEEFADFVNRYRALSRNARQPGEAGQRATTDWEATLRSLGLERAGRALREGKVESQKTPGLRESNRSRPPQGDQERFDAFRKDILGR